jgi:hypothetical protein
MEKRYFIDLERVPKELRGGIEELKEGYPITFKRRKDTPEVSFSVVPVEREEGGFHIMPADKGVHIRYVRVSDAFRALGCLFGQKEGFKSTYTETTNFRMLGVMLESSRNGVLTVDNVKNLLRIFSLMGINTVMLYTEDTYEVPGEPFFGYLRGRYTGDELKEIDSYAERFGIEMVACIQTLAHLSQLLKWPAYSKIADTPDILLVGKEETYQLLEKMIQAASSPYRSKRIHIGMDEAHGLGTGQYKNLFGERRPFDIMNEHLKRVCEICRRAGLKPMIWDDMYFRIGSKTNDYYDLNLQVPEEVIKDIPQDVDFIYWDYYHLESDFYSKFIEIHRNILGKEPIVAPGAWNWNRFWTDIPYAYMTIDACMQSCREKGIREALLTTWGDDGMENDIYSVLPVVQFFTELAYSGKVERDALKAKFAGSCGIDIEGYEMAGRMDIIPFEKDGNQVEKKEVMASNPAKWLLWDDPLIGLYEPFQDGNSFREKYERLSSQLKKEIRKGDLSERLVFPYHLSKVIAIKCDIRKNLVAAYKKKDKKELRRLLKEEVEPLIKEARKLWKIHRQMWLDTYKPFGLEVIEIRYGGLITRLESLKDRLGKYLKGEIISIPEFETQLLKFKDDYGAWYYRKIATPSSIF